jgi:RimJ/RimL family protein N-acetyltransferase
VRGEQILLTPLRDEDSDALYRWINDRELVELSARFAPVDRSDHDAWFENSRARSDVMVFAIRTTPEERLVGTCQLLLDEDGRSAELRIRIGERDVWGRGLGTEAVGLLVTHAFDHLGLASVWLQVFASNTRARRLYERAGFRVEGDHDAGSLVMRLDNASV